MATFNTATLTAVRNPAFEIATGPITYDASTTWERTFHYNLTQGVPAGGGGGVPPSYCGQKVRFDVSNSLASRVMFEKSFIKVSGFAADTTSGTIANIPAHGVSIPWNTTAALLRTAKLDLNDSQTTVEKIESNLGHASMVKYLLKYPREVLESRSEAFFTPCIEDTRDLNTGIVSASTLSVQSAARADHELIGSSGPRRVSKNIYLADLFDSLNTPAAYPVKKTVIELSFKNANEILIYDTGYLAAQTPAISPDKVGFYITNVDLYVTLADMSEPQKNEDLSRMSTNEAIMSVSYLNPVCVATLLSNNGNLIFSSVKNAQGALMMISSTDAADGIGCNSYQYCYGNGTGSTTNGLFSYQFEYNNTSSPNNPVAVYVTRGSDSPQTTSRMNSEAYAQYKMLARKISEKEITPALTLDHFSPIAQDVNTIDITPYALFGAQFYPQTAALHRNMSGSELRVNSTGGAGTNVNVIIVELTASFLEIYGNTQVSTYP